MEMEHFSHRHPLSLLRVREQQQKEKYEGRKLICYGCRQPISSGDLAYFCTQDECEDIFCLHKPCAELPTEIIHPHHKQHTFILYKTPVYSPRQSSCWWCHKDLDGFTYNCSLCQINVDIRCVMEDHSLLSAVLDRYLNHKSHAHRLILKPRPALFFCTACGTEFVDQSYSCTKDSCSFWIHRTCALLPEILESKHHNHPLSLAYSFPSAYQDYGFDCGICRREHSSAHWVYHCTRCRYFVHLRCAFARLEEDKSKQLHEDCSIKLPGSGILQVSNIFVELTRNFLGKYGLAQQLLEEINHFSHEHPLILSIDHEKDVKEIRNEEALICEGCILPIYDSYYSCEKCNYFLHTFCSQFPKQFQHPSHLEHPLVLRKLQRSFSYLQCSFCRLQCNGLLYNCEVCQFRLDLKCAVLGTISVIVHEAHTHPLVHKNQTSIIRCKSCGEYVLGPSFGCGSCKFYLDYMCAFLPRHITHYDSYRVYKRDSHPLTLMYPPFSDHPDEFYCEICEEEIHPVDYWLYHCSECDRSFHSKCFVELGKYRNIKFGSTLEALNHTHALKFIIRGGFTPFCACCDGDLYSQMAFECRDCDYYLCYSCGINSQYSGPSILKSSVDNIQMIVAEDSNSVLEDEDQAQNSINLPIISDISLELTTHFLKQHGITGSELSAEIKHFSHKHPLTLSANHPEDEEILICDGCIRPISDPYYCCKECDYFLHTYCAQLPEEIQHPLHYQHSLVLLKGRGDESCCFCISSSCKGLSFTCKEKCTFQLHIPCAILTASNFIKHEAHSHQLLPTEASWGFWPCSGCRNIIYHSRSLSCVDCSFHLHVECAFLTRFARHIKDEHPLVLTSHSFSHQVKVIHCRSCMQNIRTIGWFYHCSQCNQSFHTNCVPAVGLRNAKYGGMLRILDHPHALKFVRKLALRFCCGYCGGWFEDEAFQCEPCGYRICANCAQKSVAKRIVAKTPRVSEAVGPSRC